MKRRVVVTGASGFVGKAVLGPLLACGWEVHAVGRRDPAVQEVRFYPVDLRDNEAVRLVLSAARPQALLHLAWSVDPVRFWTDPENAQWVGITERLARYAIASGVERIVGLGTCAEYDWRDGGIFPRCEGDPTAPDTPYGTAKLDAHARLDAACRSAGVASSWLRLFHLLGERQPGPRLVPAVGRALLAGQPVALGPGNLVRDFSDVGDVGRWMADVLSSTAQGPVNVASGVPHTIREIGDALGELTGRPDLLRWRDEAASTVEPIRMLANVHRLRGLSASFSPTPLKETLARCLDSLRAAHWPA